MGSAFRLKTKPEIVEQQEATILAMYEDPNLDLNFISLLKGILEATSLTAAEIYVLIGKLLDLFDRRKCKGTDLDRRALEFGAAVFEEMKRRAANSSLAYVLVGDGTVRKTAKLSTGVNATSVTCLIDSATGWPTAGAVVVERGTLREETIVFTRVGVNPLELSVVSPASGFVNPHLINGTVETIATTSVLQSGIIVGATNATLAPNTSGVWPASGTVIFERDTIRRESRTFTRVGSVLTLGAGTTFAHAAGTAMILSTFGSDRPIVAGSACYVPESIASVRVLFRTKGAGSLLDGDFISGLIEVESDGVGSQTRVGSNTITQWQTEPFATATVTNPNAAVRGRDQEDDDSYNARISAFIQSLSRATALAIETLVAGKQDPFSNLTIAFAQTVEPVAPGEALLYVSDGSTTFAIDHQVFNGRDVLIADARANDRRARLHNYGPFLKQASPVNARTPRLFKSSERGVSTSTGSNFLEDTTKTWVVNQWVGYILKTDDNQFYPIVSNTAIRLTVTALGAVPSSGSYAIINFLADPLEPDVDYQFNMSNGDLELTIPLALHDALVAADDNAVGGVGGYTYTRGLAAYAQRLVNGDRTDLDNFPGIKALGTQCRVTTPTIITPTIQIQVITQSGFADTDLMASVQSVVQSYINGLGIGEEVKISEIIRLVKGLAGVSDCKVLIPVSNVAISDGQMPRVNASDVQVV
jgi:hypothetical protein